MPNAHREEDAPPPEVFEKAYTAALVVPVMLINKGEIVPIGHYKVAASKKSDGKNYIDLYQGAALVAQFPAYESGHDYNEETLNYVKLIPADEGYVKIIYGSLENNLETLIRMYEENE